MITERTSETQGGLRYDHVVFVEDGTTVQGEEWSIPVSLAGQITLLEADLTNPGAGASTIQTAVGAEAGGGWVLDAQGHIDQAKTAGPNIRVAMDKRFWPRGGRLYFRSLPDADLDPSQTIVTRVTIVWGHVS